MKKRHNIKQTYLWSDLLIIAAIVLIGTLLLPLNSGWASLGGIIIAFGIAMLPFFRHGYRIEGENGIYKIEEILVNRENKDAILAFIQGTTTTLEVQAGNAPGAIVDLYKKRCEETILAQYFDYKLHLEGTDFPITRITLQQAEEIRKLKITPATF